MGGLKITIKGKVQGVGFRYNTQKKANVLRITGTVENKFDGSVEIFAFGDSRNLELFKNWCHKGPNFSYVKDVKIKKIEYKDLKTFLII